MWANPRIVACIMACVLASAWGKQARAENERTEEVFDSFSPAVFQIQIIDKLSGAKASTS